MFALKQYLEQLKDDVEQMIQKKLRLLLAPCFGSAFHTNCQRRAVLTWVPICKEAQAGVIFPAQASKAI